MAFAKTESTNKFAANMERILVADATYITTEKEIVFH